VVHPASYPKSIIFLGWIKSPDREADNFPTTIAKVKRTLNYTSTLPTRLHAVLISLLSRGTLIFTFLFNIYVSYFSLSFSRTLSLFSCTPPSIP
jgi:hypothetical protein